MRALLTLAALITLACSQDTTAVSERQPDDTSNPASTASVPAARRGQAVEVEMHNVDLRVTSDVTLQVRHLRGRFTSAGRSEIPYLDDKHSYAVVVDSAEIALDFASLNALMNASLRDADANVEHVRISSDNEHALHQKGVLDKGIKVPFDMKGTVEATPDGHIRLHPSSVRGLGLPIKPMMHVFGIDMADVIKLKRSHGISVEGDDLILNPQELIPAPPMRGKVTAVHVTDGAIVQTFGSGERRRLSPQATSQNYIYWRGGTLQFGKLTMADTDLELIDEDPKDAFDFSVDHWNDQLVAGYSKNTPGRGLKTHMPDYGDLRKESK
jgi:hypothetical protein